MRGREETASERSIVTVWKGKLWRFFGASQAAIKPNCMALERLIVRGRAIDGRETTLDRRISVVEKESQNIDKKTMAEKFIFFEV